MKNKIAIVKGGFLDLYLHYFEKLCADHNIKIDFFEKGTMYIENPDIYDFVLSDNTQTLGACKIFHQHTILYQLSKSNNLLYNIIYSIFHIKKIRNSFIRNKSYKKAICVSTEIQRDLEKFYKIPQEKIILAHAGFVEPEENNDNKEFKKFDYNSTFTVCTSAAGFVTKGGYTLLNALREFRKMFPNIKIKANIIYPKYKKNLGVKLFVKLFKLSDMVEFYGYQDNINSFYNQSQCLICQSVYEAFGRIVTEAMYQKIPVIVGSNIGASDIVEDGVNGFIFEDNKNRYRNLALKIKEAYDKYNDLNPLVENAYKTSKQLTWQDFAKKIFYGLYPEYK